MQSLVVGLGNPGREYESTRHNIGFRALEYLSFSRDLVWKEKFKGLYSSYGTLEDKTYFLKPQTYMNLSGESVQPMAKFFKVKPQDILVVYDEIDIPFGTLVLKRGGGLAGHNGLKSIAQVLGTQDFLRLRLGVGRPEKGSVSNWVLKPFSQDEEIVMEKYMEAAAGAIEAYIEGGFDKAARKYSRLKIIE